jgi:general secretion pathway protein D
MSLISRLQRVLHPILALVATVSFLALVPSAAAQGSNVTLNFKDADVDAVIGAFGVMLNRTFSIDPRVRGKITLEAPRPVPRQQAYELLLGQLRLQGFTVVEGPGFTRVVPEADAKLQGGPVISGPTPPRGAATGDQIVTQIFEIKFESASSLVPVLRPLIAPNNTIVAYPSNNSLVITDYAANLKRIARIIATLDSPRGNDMEVIAIQHAIASDVAVMLSRALDDTQRAGAGQQVDPGQRTFVMADPRTNSILIRSAAPAKVNLARALIQKFDQPSTTPGDIHVVYLRNAEAVKLAQTLRSVLSNEGGGSAASGSAPTPAPAGAPGASAAATQPLNQGSSGATTTSFSARGASIAADASLNALIITAPDPIYRNLRAVIDRLDVRRAQVFIETLIVEVRDDRSAELGIQWQALGALGGSNTRGAFGGTNYGTTGNILGVSQNPASAGAGLNLGFVDGTATVNIGGVATKILNIPLLLRALGNDTRNNIIATPNLVTVDNEEARIVIGRNVPFVTGQFTNAGGANVSPFQTIERKDVGTILRVKPQVSESGAVKLVIAQELSTVDAAASKDSAAGLITSKRSIESTVIVDDGQLFVLGGLIQDEVADGESRVPLLGSIPFLGQLFRNDTRARSKSNLLVFLRPIVIRGADTAYAVTADRYDYIRQIQGDSRMPSHWALPNFSNPALPVQPQPASVPKSERRNEPISVSPQVEEQVQRPAPIQSPSGALMRPGSNEVYVPLPGPRVEPRPDRPDPALR